MATRGGLPIVLLIASAAIGGQTFELISPSYPGARVIDLVVTTAGDIAVACETEMDGLPAAGLLLLSPRGEIEAEAFHDVASVPVALTETPDGELVFLTMPVAEEEPGIGLTVSLFDPSGRLLRSAAPLDTFPVTPAGIFYSPEAEGLILSGTLIVHTPESQDDSTAFFIAELSPDLEVVWTSRFSVAPGDRAVAVADAGDGGCVVAGTTSGGAVAGTETVLLRAAHGGGIPWCRRFTTSGRSRPTDIVPIGSDGYLLVGEWIEQGALEPDVLLMRIDPDGGILWTESYDGLGIDCATSVDRSSEGGFVISASTTDDASTWEGTMLMRLDETGELVWRRYYTTRRWNVVSSVAATADGGCVAAGYTDYGGFGGPEDPAGQLIWVLRTDPDGFTGETADGSGELP